MSSTTATVMTIEQEAAPRMSLSQRPKSDPAPFLRARDNEIDIELNTRPSHEQSSPAAQIPNSEAVSTEQVQTLWNPYKNRFRVLACCSYAFANGMNDSAPGALIASIESHYRITYGTVSIIFVCNALGFIAAAFFISSLSRRLGRAKAMVVAEGLLILGYTTVILTPPFPAVAISFFVLGVGLAINLAIGQVFCSNLANNTAILGAFQGSYGIGGITGPLIATAMISKDYLWSRFYLIELGLAFFNLIFSAWAYWKYEAEIEGETSSASGENRVVTDQPPSQGVSSSKSKWRSFRTLTSDKTTILGSLFVFAYQGAEVAISGWIISFLVQFRNGDPSRVGYVTSGFWAGITLGRFTLSFLAHRMGERRFVFIATAGALILELLIWFVPSIPGDSVAVAFSGLLLGPMYPSAVHIFQRLIPRKMQISSLSLIASVGSSGGAFAPFLTGILAQSVGTFVLHPVCIALFVGMVVTWWMLPVPEVRDE